MAKQIYKIRMVKLNKPSKYKYNIISVTNDKKHQYFIVKSKIYQHEFIETISYKDCDYIEVYGQNLSYGMFANDNPIKVVNQE